MTLTQINKAGLDELALDHVFTIGASGTDHYTFQGEGLNGTVNDPTLYLTRGKTYRFENGTGAHPIRIQSTSGASGTAYNTGVTNNAGSGTVIVEVQHDAPDVLYYQCTSHANMNGVLYITGALADGGVTTAKLADDAVTDAKLANSINTAIAANTAKTTNATHTGDVTGSTSLTIANDAVTTAKIAANAVTHAEIAADSVSTSELASGAVTTVKIGNEQVTLAKLEHGTSSNDGKFLRANNGADPSFETVTSTTINNNADNRVITGSGTANTLNGESNVIIDNSSRLKIGSINNSEALTNAPVYIEVQTDLSAIDTNVGTTTTGLLRMTDDGTSTDRYHGIELRNRQGGDIRILCQDRNTSDKGDLVIGMPNIASGMAERIRFSSIYDSINIAGKGGTSLAAQGAAIQNVDVYLNTKTNITNVGEYAGQAATGLIRFEDVGADNNRFHGIELRNRNSGDVRFMNADLGASNKADAVIVCDSGSSIFENARFLHSGGIAFNGDTAAANALDDYEEGTWTPNISFGYNTYNQSYANQVGRYTKIGNRVYVTCYVQFSNKGTATGTARVGGLPFTTVNINNFYQHGSVWINGWNGSSTVPTGYGQINTTSFRLERQRADGAGNGVSTMDNTNFNNSTDIMLSFHYQAA